MAAGHGGFAFVDVIPFLNKLPHHVSNAIVVALVLLVAAFAAMRRLSRDPEGYVVPEDRITLRNLFDLSVEGILKFLKDNMGPRGPEFMMIIGALAFFIFFSNIWGLLPGFQSPTETLNTTGACALTVFFLTHYYGIREHGLKYIKHFMGPVIWLAPLFFPIELISHMVRPVSLSIRLFGNIFGDHYILGIVFSLVPLLVPLPMMLLGLFVAVVQTLVFILLSMAYFAGAIEEMEHE
ncbi:MAG: ATP synthase F0 subunit A [Deltaproteobacteria bacterium]|nr:MAG: ATP synthase F0 subunit A [Deltaproteobacteria bacterium]